MCPPAVTSETTITSTPWPRSGDDSPRSRCGSRIGSLGRYGKIFALGHRATKGLLDKPVVVEEKVDGSQISWGLVGDPPRLWARSKRLTLDLDEPPNLFAPSVASIQRMAEDHLLTPGVVYRGEAMGRPRHNTLAYGRVPQGHIALFDVDAGTEDYLGCEEKARVATRLGIEAVPLLFEGVLSSPARLEKLLELESFLGGPRIEGVVIKRAHEVPLFGEDGLPIRAKFVSEKFKEAHAVNPDWKRLRQTEFLRVLAESVSGPARWEKVVTGLMAEGLIEGGTPVEIGRIIGYIREDVRDECLDDLKDRLWKHFERRFDGAVTKGFPEWYKKRLAEAAFGE